MAHSMGFDKVTENAVSLESLKISLKLIYMIFKNR